MRIVVIGAGAVGSLYGAFAARGGASVTLFARGPHLTALRDSGLRVCSAEAGEFVLRLSATDDPSEVPPAHVVLVCAPLHQYPPLGDALRRACAAGGVVVPVANGVDAVFRLRALADGACVVHGTTKVQCHLEQPGVVVQTSKKHELSVGSVDVASALRKVSLSAVGSRSPWEAVWAKAAFLIPVTLACVESGSDLGTMRKQPGLWKTVLEMSEEIQNVARSVGVSVSAGSVGYSLERASGKLTPSACLDARERPASETEIPYLVEPILKRAESGGVSVPQLSRAYRAVVGDPLGVDCPGS